MREWFKKTTAYWTFGIFLLALFGTMGGVGVWGLNARDAEQNAKVEKVSSVAKSEGQRVEAKTEAEVKRLDGRAETNLVLIERINAKLDRMDGKLDTLLMRVAAPPAK